MERKVRHTRTCVAWMLAVGLLCWGGSASAQDEMDFSEGGEEEVGGEAGGGEGGGDDALNFNIDEVVESTPQGEGPPITGLVIAADEDADPSLAAELTDVAMRELDKLKKYRNTPNQGLQDKFSVLGAQGAVECAYDTLCLANLGRELGVDYLLVGRLTGTPGSYGLNLDLVDVKAGAVSKYVTRSVPGGRADLEKAIADSFPRLFDLNTGRRTTGPVVEAEIGTVQKTLAWTTAGLGLVFVGAGVYFGLDASSIEDELVNGARRAEAPQPYNVTQKAAQSRLEDAEGSALLANVFYGLGVAAGGASLLLFLIRPGSDIATEEELSWEERLQIAPTVSAEGAGVSAGFTW